MAKQVIQLGTPPTGVGGDTPRSANIKINSNFDELYAADLVNYKRANILGTVSQSGGVPTGAIIERGTNANGDFIKFADGTMICWKVYTRSNVSFGPQGVVSFSATIGNEQFPATFAAEPYQATTVEGVGITLWVAFTWGTPGTMWAQANAVTGYNVTGPYTFVVRRYAVGRWF
ncbi:hypothetical protein [Pseudomonas chlororaphis]|uniref:hypothetical protein n=1 Tax=Pseudomonas chlororaphis TaxID=587753 RepID=UPI002408641A|nr:hypothetical protein [Pseudomonas chlororaphis]